MADIGRVDAAAVQGAELVDATLRLLTRDPITGLQRAGVMA